MSGGFILPALALGFGAIIIRPRRGFFPAGTARNPTGAVALFGLVPQTIIDEDHHHELEITQHPIEAGAPIADHAYKVPEIVRIHAMWSNSPSQAAGVFIDGDGATTVDTGALGSIVTGTIAGLDAIMSTLSGNAPNQAAEIFDHLLLLQESRVPFDVFTGKRIYTNMLLRSIIERTVDKTENALDVTLVCQQVIIVDATVTQGSVPTNPAQLENPESNLSPVELHGINLGPAQEIIEDILE